MPKFHPLTVKEIRQETPDCVSVAFQLPENLRSDFDFLPGQYLTLKANVGGEELRRSYSICSSPGEEELRVAIKKVDGGRFSTFANEQLTVGTELEVMTPMGNFHIPLSANKRGHYVAFAAGSGITPVISILKSVMEVESDSQFTLFYGNRSLESIIFREEIEALKNKFMGRLSVHYVMSGEFPGSDLFYGRINEEKCEAYCNKLLDIKEVDAFFLCGPYSMIEGVKDTLYQLGVAKGKVHFELFTAPDQIQPTEAPKTEEESFEVMVSITLDGNTVEFPMQSEKEAVLDAALKAGADLPFACKGGVCCTCRAKLIEGEVNMKVNYALEEDEVEAGYVLTCQSYPKTNVIKVDFDA
jgi:ring-1,2-phenylacetyl-CoA epoxidase subunit PaaE